PTSRSAAGRRPGTATARRATLRSTRSPSGSRSTSTSAAGSSGRRLTNSEGVEIPPVTIDDLDVLIDIYLDTARHHAVIDPEVFHVPDRAAIEVRLRRRIEGRGVTGEYIAAMIGDTMVGSASLDIADPPSAGNMARAVPTAEFGVSVVDGWRGRGIGRALIPHLQAGAPDHGRERSILHVPR